MNKLLIIILLISILITISCDKITESDTQAPTVSITYPANNSEFVQGEVITITADANDNKGIEEVEFYIDNVNVYTDDTAPYEYDWDTGAGKDTNHPIYAKAFDTSDNSSTSDVITVIITEGAGTVTDIDGNVYQTIIIGDQEWMMENLKVTRYRNGDQIPEVTDNGTWNGLSTGAWCNYNNDAGNSTIYGHLYNWYAVDDSRGIAPEGWHVPTDAEWTALTDYLGGSSVAGGKMKETDTTHWNSPNTGATNESGFTVLPGGYRSYGSGYFNGMGYYCYFWSSSEYHSSSVWTRRLNYDSSVVYRGYSHKENGFSIRCVRSVE